MGILQLITMANGESERDDLQYRLPSVALVHIL